MLVVRPVCEAGRFAGGMCANEVRARARKRPVAARFSRARAREPIFDVCFRVCSLVRFFVFFVAVVVCSWSLLLLLTFAIVVELYVSTPPPPHREFAYIVVVVAVVVVLLRYSFL